mmetsp:Transcript_78321/g.226456  ORF Transcript_78321/g.226456 Transcript_78321/m.226456 type:complete len:265 (+) Transcript_78321:806-1600(+)
MGCAPEWHSLLQQEEPHHANAEHVGLEACTHRQDDLRSDISRCADLLPDRIMVIVPTGAAKICDHGGAVLAKHNVRGLDVAVDDATLVDMRQAAQAVGHDTSDSFLGVHALRRTREQVAGAQLHRQTPKRQRRCLFQKVVGVVVSVADSGLRACDPEQATKLDDVWMALHSNQRRQLPSDSARQMHSAGGVFPHLQSHRRHSDARGRPHHFRRAAVAEFVLGVVAGLEVCAQGSLRAHRFDHEGRVRRSTGHGEQPRRPIVRRG